MIQRDTAETKRTGQPLDNYLTVERRQKKSFLLRQGKEAGRDPGTGAALSGPDLRRLIYAIQRAPTPTQRRIQGAAGEGWATPLTTTMSQKKPCTQAREREGGLQL
jgi:hypothetical protein